MGILERPAELGSRNGDRSTPSYRRVSPGGLELWGAVPGSVGDLRRATSGEGETEPKQIGEGTRNSTLRRAPLGTWRYFHVTPLIFGDKRKEGKQEEQKPAQEVNEQERARAFKTCEEDILVVDEAPVEGEAEGNRQAQLVPRKKKTEGYQCDEQGHVAHRDRQLHCLYVFHNEPIYPKTSASNVGRFN